MPQKYYDVVMLTAARTYFNFSKTRQQKAMMDNYMDIYFARYINV